MAWKHGELTINGATVSTSWRANADGLATHVDVPRGTAADAKIGIDGTDYVIELLTREELPDRNTVPVITVAEMDRRKAALAEEAAKARADFEGVAVPEDKPEKASAKPRKG